MASTTRFPPRPQTVPSAHVFKRRPPADATHPRFDLEPVTIPPFSDFQIKTQGVHGFTVPTEPSFQVSGCLYRLPNQLVQLQGRRFPNQPNPIQGSRALQVLSNKDGSSCRTFATVLRMARTHARSYCRVSFLFVVLGAIPSHMTCLATLPASTLRGSRDRGMYRDRRLASASRLVPINLHGLLRELHRSRKCLRIQSLNVQS